MVKLYAPAGLVLFSVKGQVGEGGGGGGKWTAYLLPASFITFGSPRMELISSELRL